MILYRLLRSKYAESAWNGDGAKLYGGRWHNVGRPAVYVATSISLALLEVLVHLVDDRMLEDYTLLSIDIPEKHIDILNTDSLPPDWKDPAPHISTMEMGTEWFDGGQNTGLMIPSAIAPYENNVMLNPTVKAFEQCLDTVKLLHFDFDVRFSKTR